MCVSTQTPQADRGLFTLLLPIKESTANCPEEAALATAWERATAAGDPSAELRELRKRSLLGQTKRSFQAPRFVD